MWTRTGRADSCHTNDPSAHLPEALELPLLDAQQLAGLPADDGGVARRVVQDGLPERCPDAQRADSDRILRANTERNQVHAYEYEQTQVQMRSKLANYRFIH